MAEDIFIEDCGCVVEVSYQYDELTQYLIDAYSLANMPQPDRIKKAWDYVIRELKSASASTYVDRFEITGTDENPDTVYVRPDLIGALLIIDVTQEGIGVNESDPLTVDINTTDGTVTLGLGLLPGQKIKITYKK